MPNSDIYVGLDLGTSGARAIAMTYDGLVVGEGKSLLGDHGANWRSPQIWWDAAKTALSNMLEQIDGSQVVALCVDGTSGTMIPITKEGGPLADARMYNDPCADQAILKTIAQHAPVQSAAHGPTSGLAKALIFQQQHGKVRVVHQADWIAGKLCGTYASDDNNALKTGFDPVAGCWPSWIENTGLDMSVLPEVNRPGSIVAKVLPEMAREFGLRENVTILAGTTDGCASFLATGAKNSGDGVSALGTTLTIKLLSDIPIFDPASGVYSHHILGKWLAGGASNTGGNVLLAHFSADEMEYLSDEIDAETDSGLDYYPLVKPGERFPISDPNFSPKMSPTPNNRVQFLKGIFEGIAGVEALAYAKLTKLGAPKLKSLRSVGGGAQNPVWTRIRERRLGVAMSAPLNNEAAYGAACLARYGMGR